MDSRLSPRSILMVVAAAVLSGAAFYLSDGLSPRWWAIWLAPIPILWISPRVPWPIAAGAATAAGLIGNMSMWAYQSRLQIPLALKSAALIMPSVAFCLAVVLFRLFCIRRRFWLAVLGFPAVMVAYEYLSSLAFGTFGATAYTQLKNLPILQLAAVAGLWGIAFVLMLAPSMIAAILLSPRRVRQPLAIAFVAIFACAFAYGLLRLSNTPVAPRTITVGLAASDLPGNLMPDKDQDAMRLMDGYAEQVKLLARRGAAIVVLPEMLAVVRDSISNRVDSLFEQTASEAHVQILVGVLHASQSAAFNEARLYSAKGTLEAVYRKHHLVPVLEGRTTPGREVSVLPQSVGVLGLEICRDMDYSHPARTYGNANVGLLLVPAWDFDIDRLWHGHMSLMRGVENGFTIVRAAKQGLLTVSDDRGRVLSETRTSAGKPFTTMLAQVPIRHDATLYQTLGDWFAWVDLALLAGLLIIAVVDRQSPRRPVREPETCQVG